MTETTFDRAWQQWYADQQRWLRAVVAARLSSADEVEEVMQEVAVAVVKDWNKLEDVSRAGPWLYRIAIRQAMLFRRRMGRQRQLMDRYSQEVGESTSQEPIEWLMGEERGKAIREAMTELPPRDREILLLKHGEGWSYQKIADHLGVTRHVVEYRLLRARKHMRSTLAAKRLLEVTS